MGAEYFHQIVIVLYLIMLGLGIVQHVSNIGHAIRLRNQIQFYGIHSLWVLMIFILQTQMAEHFYGFRAFENWSNLYVLLAMVNPIIMYMVVVLAFPDMDNKQGVIDLKQHYYDNRIPLFSFLAILPITNYVTHSVFIEAWSVDKYDVFMFIFSGLFVFLVVSNAEKVHRIIVVSVAILFIVFSIIFSAEYTRQTIEENTVLEGTDGASTKVGSDSGGVVESR